ncbi:MAG: hypothetical protein JSV03_11635 [Planctomycetota bacterium]|nr:MAG: hypothetical protein JSV03_11635 [Planctomycetota bacterium]
MFHNLIKSALCLTAGVLLQTSSCLIDASVEPGSDVDPNNVRIRFVNQSSQALDVLFYATAADLTNPADVDTVLFTPANQVIANIGFAGSGLIPAGETDEITLNGANARTLGTRGGAFINKDTGEHLGTGQQRVFSINLQYSCGDTLSIVYKATATGYETSWLLN